MAGRKRRRGDIGPVRMNREGAEWLKVSQPDTKEELERHHAEQFVAAFNHAHPIPGLDIYAIQQNPQSSLDFLLKTSNGDKWLELMEIAPFDIFPALPDEAPNQHNSYELAKFLHKKISEKSRKYRSKKPGNLILLLYLTDWRFSPGDTTIAMLQYWCNRKKHSFELIFIFEDSNLMDGIIRVIAPTPSEFWVAFDPEKYRENVTINLDPSKWQLIEQEK
jgi:hypothetical protein